MEIFLIVNKILAIRHSPMPNPNPQRLELRILLENPTKSYHAKHRTNKNDIFDNRLIFGDNLLALKALKQ